MGMVLIAFGAGLLCGAFAGHAGSVLLSAQIGGVAAAILFLLLTSVLALLVTLVQSIWRRSFKSFGSWFMKNLDGAMEFLIQGWP